MSDVQRQPRALQIEVVDARGIPLSGAWLQILRRGQLIGEVLSSGQTTIAADDLGSLAITAIFDGRTETIRPTSLDVPVVFTFAPTRFVETASVPTARCPDGSSGQPCVTCRLDGEEYEICA